MSECAHLVVGLGNPGEKYANTPHNVGFRVVDWLAERWGASSFQSKHQGLLTSASFQGKKIQLLKPQTYMNLSGDSVGKVARFFKIPAETHVCVVVDDLDLPLGQLRLRKSGGSGGHNGLKSVESALGTQKYMRLRIGVGRGSANEASDHVLSRIPKREQELYAQTIVSAGEGIELVLDKGVDIAMNSVNQTRAEAGKESNVT